MAKKRNDKPTQRSIYEEWGGKDTGENSASTTGSKPTQKQIYEEWGGKASGPASSSSAVRGGPGQQQKELNALNAQKDYLQKKDMLAKLPGWGKAKASDAERADYYANETNYNAKYGHEWDYDESYKQYKAYRDKAARSYEAEGKINKAADVISDKTSKAARGFSEMFGGNDLAQAEKDLKTKEKRLVRDADYYSRMAEDAARSRNEEMYGKAERGYTDATRGYLTEFGRYQKQAEQAGKDWLDNLHETNRPAYFAQTLSADQIEGQLRMLNQQRAELEPQALEAEKAWVIADQGNYTDRELLYLGRSKRLQEIEDEIAVYEQALKHKNRLDYEQLSSEMAPMGYLTDPELKAKAKTGEAKWNADRQKAEQAGQMEAYKSLSFNEEEPGSPITVRAGMKNSGWDFTIEEAKHLKLSDQQIFFALYADDPEKAIKFAREAKDYRDEGYSAQLAEAAGQDAGSRLAAFIGGTAFNWASGAGNLLETAITGDPYSENIMEMSRTGRALISGGAQGLTEKGLFNTGILSGTIDENAPVVGYILGGKGLGDLYQLGSSILESTTTAAIAASAGDYADAISALGVIIMGSSASVADYDECLKRGLTEKQALHHALAAGINEAAFEWISMDKLVNPDYGASALKRWFTQAGVEASEEFCTTVANRLADGYLARKEGYDTQIEQRMKELIALGMAHDEAKEKAQNEWQTDLINDALGGFISGGGTMAINQVLGYGLSKGGQAFSDAMDRLQASNKATAALEAYGSAITDAGQIEALRSYAEANGIDFDADAVRGQETRAQAAESGTGNPSPTEEGGTGDTSHTAENDGKAEKQSRKERKQEAQTNRSLGAVQEQTIRKISETVRERGLNSAQAVTEELVAQHGEGIRDAAQTAVTRVAKAEFKNATTAAEMENIYRSAIEGVRSTPVRQAIESAYRSSLAELVLDETRNADARRSAGAKFRTMGRFDTGVRLKGEDGKTSSVQIADVVNNAQDVVLSDGRTVSVKELKEQGAISMEAADLLDSMAFMKVGDAAGVMWKAFMQGADNRTSSENYRYAMDWAQLYEQGRVGDVSLEDAVAKSKLDPREAMDAYTEGVKAREASDRAEQAQFLKNRERNAALNRDRQGKFDMGDVSEEAVKAATARDATVKEQIEQGRIISEALGVPVRMFDSSNDFERENGRYEDGVIWLDINAGRNSAGDLKHGLLAVLGHELTHWMQEYGGQSYIKYRQAVVSAITREKGRNYLEALINDQRSRNSELTHSQAIDEIVADASMDRMGDAEFWQTVADNLGDDKAEVKSKILQFVRDFFDKLLEALGASQRFWARDVVASMQKDVQKTLAALYAEGIREASRNQKQSMELAKDGVAIDPASGVAVMNSIRTAPQTQEEKDALVERLVNAVGPDGKSLGFTREESQAWVDSLSTVSTEILTHMAILDYESDERYSWLKKNSDYTQGSIAFNNNCPKRTQFTAIFDKLQREFPNRVFTASDYEAIRQTLIDHGVTVTCGPCFVEDRRQHTGEIAQSFLDQLQNGSLANKFQKLVGKDTYIPTQYDLVTYDGLKELYKKHRGLHDAFIAFNNARGMAAARLLEGMAEYNGQIKKWNKGVIRGKNNKGGLRIFSLSDADIRTMIDIIQITIDASEKGLMIQGYTKKPWFAKMVKDTGMRILRSHIPKGNGIFNGKIWYDDVEGINRFDKNYRDENGNDIAEVSQNIGDNIIGINDDMIRLAMRTREIDQIIPFHSSLANMIRNAKKIGDWYNYKNDQTDKVMSTGKVADKQVNIYKDVINAWAAKGTPITNKVEFVNAFLEVCRNRGLTPRFSRFLNTDAKGNFVYTEGYEKFLVDYKLFDRNTGEIIPQVAVRAQFDDAYNKKLMQDYVKGVQDIKVADEATYEDVKKLFSGSGARKSSRATDDAYMKAVEDGDMETAQRMVDDYSIDAGYDTPKLYHGTRAFGFTRFDLGKGENLIFASDNRRVGETYSGETKRARIPQRASINADDLSGQELLSEAQKYIKKYRDFVQVTDEQKEQIKTEAREDITNIMAEIADFANNNEAEFNTEGKQAVLDDLLNALSRLSTADDSSALLEALDAVNSAMWDLLDLDAELESKIEEIANPHVIYNKKNLLDDFTYKGTIFAHKNSFDGNKFNSYAFDLLGHVNDKQLALEVNAELHKGVYELYGKSGRQLVIDANGANWNQITPPAKLNLHGPQVTRSIAMAAKALGYNSVLIKNLRDSGGETPYNAPSNIYIFFDAASVKSADPVTYDDKGKPIPLSERFNPEKEDIRYSRRSAQEKRDAGEKLTESQFYSLYSAHKINMSGKGDVQAMINSILADGFQGDGGQFGNNVMPTNISYRQDADGKRIPIGLSAQKYAPKKGEHILLVPTKSGVERRGGKYNFTERVKQGYKPAFDYEIVQADYDNQPYYEMYSKAYDQAEKPAARYSTRDQSQRSDLELMDDAAEYLSEAGGEEYWQALLEAAPELAGDENSVKALLRDFQAQAEKLAQAEKDLEAARRELKPTNRKLRTQGISNVVKDVMKYYGVTDAKNNKIVQKATKALIDGYQKALDAIDAGKTDQIMDITYEAAVQAAEILLTEGRITQNFGGKWSNVSAETRLGEDRQQLVDYMVAAVRADFALNRYREAIPETAADRLIAKTQREMQKKVDAQKAKNAELTEQNERLTRDSEWLKEQAEAAKGHVGAMNTELNYLKEKLKNSASMSSKERSQLKRKAKNLNERLQKAKEEAKAWKQRAEQEGKLATQYGEKQAALIKKLEAQKAREQAILEGKLKPLAMQRILKAVREAENKKVTQQKDERFAKYKDNQKASQLRSRIKNLADEMKRTMTKPTDNSYVPAALYGSMVKLADALDGILAPTEGTKAADRYKAVMDQIHALGSEYRAVKNMDDPVYASEYDEEIQDEIDELVKTLLGEDDKGFGPASLFPDKPRNMTTENLQKVYDILKYINYSMKNAAFMMSSGQFKSVYDAIRSVVEQQKAITPIADVGKHEANKRRRLLGNLSPMRAVEMMSNWDRNAALYDYFQAVEQGTVDVDSWIMDYNKSLQALKTGKNEKAYRDAMTKLLDFGAKDRNSGKAVRMTKMQALQLLMTWQREQANPKQVHLQKGGAVIRDALAIQDGKASKATQHTVSVTPEMIQRITDSLTEWDKAYMKALRSYLTMEGKETNKILYKLKHRVLATEENYIPYVVDKSYLEAKLDSADVYNIFVKSFGSTQALQTKAPQPVIIDGLDTMMTKHVRDAANYIGLAIPIRDFAKVFNGRLASEDGGVYTSLQHQIQENFDQKGTDLITQALIDVQGGSRHQSWGSQIAENLNRLQGAFVRSALLVNPSVTIKQAASYIAAESVLSHRALVEGNRAFAAKGDKSHSPSLIAHIFASPEGRTAQRIYNEIDKYTSMHYVRRQGMSHAELAEAAQRGGKLKRIAGNVGASMEQNVIGHAARKGIENLDPTKWIQRMDVATTAALWVACKEQARMDGMESGTEEFWQHTTELYERVLRETQPMYDGLHRTAHQKQQGGLMQYLFPFRTVPIQNHGQIAAAYETLKASKNKSKAEQKAAQAFFAKTAWAQTESAFVFALMTFVAAALKRKTKKYRDEDEEFTAESFLRGFGTDMASTLFSVAFPVFGSELWNAGSGAYGKLTGSSAYSYDAFSVGVVDMLNDLISASDKLLTDAGKLVRGEDVSWSDFGDHGLALLLKGAKLAGIPADTVKTYFQGIKGNAEDVFAGRIPALNDESWERASSVNANRYFKAWQAGDTAKQEIVLSELSANAGGDEEKVRNAINGVFKDAYEAYEIDLDEYTRFIQNSGLFDSEKQKNKIRDLARDALTAGELTEEDAIRYLTGTGLYDEDEAWKKAREWAGKAEHADDEEYSFSQYGDLRDAFASGQGVEEAVQELKDHGFSDNQLSTEISADVRSGLQSGNISEDEAIGYLTELLGKDEDAAWKTVQKWQAEAEHAEDEDYSWSQYDAIDEAIDGNKDIRALTAELTAHGVDEKNIASHVKSHLAERFEQGLINETQFKNQLSRYCGIVGETADKLVRNANVRKATGYSWDELDNAYRDGNVSASEAKQMLTKYGGMSAGDASSKIRYWDFQKAYPDAGLSQQAVDKYYDTVITGTGSTLQKAGISLDTYVKYYSQASKAQGTDLNHDGRTDSGSKKAAVMKIIDGLNITRAQKDALYYFNGWSAKTIYEAPWH